MKRSVLAISVGDPAGVGPMVTSHAVARATGTEGFALCGDAKMLASLLLRHGATRPVRVVKRGDAFSVGPGEIVLVDTGVVSDVAVHARKPTLEAGVAQLAALDAATELVRGGLADALVTGPTSKAAVHASGVRFTGQTEHLARAAGLSDDAVTMMFLGPRLRVALATTHLSIADVPRVLRAEHVTRAAVHLGEALLALGEHTPRVVVAGLNPHAGEGGMFGDEEIRVLGPAIAAARARKPFSTHTAALEGPRPAEAVFREAAELVVQGVVAMYHDQATVPSKLLDWTSAVNVTWGLPFVRTSVDHGVAYDAAARGEANPAGMVAAIDMALRLTRGAK